MSSWLSCSLLYDTFLSWTSWCQTDHGIAQDITTSYRAQALQDSPEVLFIENYILFIQWTSLSRAAGRIALNKNELCTQYICGCVCEEVSKFECDLDVRDDSQ